ncbi:MAG: Gfo/Idh/MocA family oxidoreductase [Proteobacteria bacterium]|nr:Gfo/Idh/MocA family oxidoreductase [Pseudomonadota bacterium]
MKPIRIGVIGVASRGEDLIKEFHNNIDDATVVAGMDVRDAHLDQFRESVGPDAFVTKDYRELAAHPDVEAVIVASPDNFHEEQGLAVLEAGKHLLLEKPMAITTAGCDRLLAAHKKAGVIFGLGLSMRYMPMFQTMKDIIDSGDIGDVKAYWCNHFVGKGGHYYFHSWHAVRANSTGLLLQKGTHDLDIMHFLTGKFTRRVVAFGGLDYYGGDYPNDLHCPDCAEKETCPEAQLGMPEHISLCAFRKEIDVEDNHVLIMELEDGIKAAYQECHFTPDYHRDHIVIGTKGRLHNEEAANTVTLNTRSRHGLSDAVHTIHPTEGEHGGGDPRLCRDFIRAIREKRDLLSDPYSARMSVAVGVAAHDSLRANGKLIEITRPQV